MGRITRAAAAKIADTAIKAEDHRQSTQSERNDGPDHLRGMKTEELTFTSREAKTITDDLLLQQQLLQTTYQTGVPSESEFFDSESNIEESATDGAIDEEELDEEEFDEGGLDGVELDEEGLGDEEVDEERRDEGDHDDESGTSHSDNTDDYVQIELYGQEAAWNNILEGARMVGVSKAQRDRTQVLPRLKTRVIGSLVKNAQKAGNYFERLNEARNGKGHEQIDALERRLARKLNQIKEQVETLTEAEAAAGLVGSETITDIYAHAIPNLVDTLRWGLLCHTDHYSRPDDSENLESIISIQDTLLLLCTKARSWKARTISSAPIKKATTQKIFPYLRDLREAFANEHEERTRELQSKQSQLQLIESHERIHEKRQREKAESAEEQERKRRILAKDLDRRYKVMFGPNRNVLSNNPPQPKILQKPSDSEFTVANEWTSEQNRALLVELTKEDSRNLPGMWIAARSMSWLKLHLAKQRYLVALNTPLLQNKLPEHIRERALYYKDALEIHWGDRDFVHSIE